MRSPPRHRIGSPRGDLDRELSVAVTVGAMRFNCLGSCRGWLFGSKAPDWTCLQEGGQSQLVKSNPLRRVYRVQCGPHEVYAKLFAAPSFADRLKWLFRGPPSRIEFEHLRTSRLRSVPTAEALAWAVGRAAGKPLAILITRSLGPTVSLEEVLWQGEAGGSRADGWNLDDSLVATAELAARLHSAGIKHGDFHPGNILLSCGSPGEQPKGWITDLQKCRIEQRSGHASADPTRRDRLANLAVLFSSIRARTSGAQQQHFIDAYLRAIQPYGHWSHRDLSSYVPRLHARADRHRRRLLRSRDRRCLGDTKYSQRIKLPHGWSGSVFCQAKHGISDSAASQCRLSSADWEQALANPLGLLETGEVLKKGGRSTVRAGVLTVGSTELQIVVKHSRLRSGVRGFFDSLRRSRAVKQWYIAHALINRQLSTAWPLAALEHHHFGRLTESIFITERISGALNLHSMLCNGELPPAGRERTELARSLGRLIGRLWLEGLRHRDCKLTNIMVGHHPDGSPASRVYLVDLDGLLVRRWPLALRPHRAIIRAAANIPKQIELPLRDLVTVFREYVSTLGLPECHNALGRKLLWEFIADRAASYSAKSAGEKPTGK